MSDKIKVAVYCRVASTAESAVEFAIKSQEETLINYAMERMLGVNEVYSDIGISGLTFDRLSFQKMMSDIRNGEINCVIVKDLTRISRNPIQLEKWLYEMREKNVRVIAMNERFDSFVTHDILNGWLMKIMEDIHKKELTKNKVGITHRKERETKETRKLVKEA